MEKVITIKAVDRLAVDLYGLTKRADECVNRRKTVARLLVLFVGLLLCSVGVFHDVVNIRSLHHAVARGEIAERMAPQLVANATS